ncbi:MAG: palmitoyl-CoA hydrolase [Alcanivorax borkumensis]|jgi:acyl-CoA thioesterase-2|uniref:Acyl-CoA thioesterase 2 n=1 Tax=Alcanivorax borkumensis (strain ATCC 700651 / DSM 11573 / NCIMB 13689 / SK2) TaxID=393595 RepID=Q0VQS1_ALCBS|nr:MULTISPECIES: acyl-CoA thioesterase II [Alcanivorax]OJH07017.1 MAG: palmitoyl-CoA hydrolase [Alcanivorax borkumensis]EUC71530.1 acyl-CoA thioesterase [Alcanivorax sp. 97CO-5]PKG02955.1 acyl-CoA thioesterase II [Alcanivorax sp. 97CO-6]CAL16477.1 acyl-CoA thioesterase II [Alcanivorax borkumensis SK2]BAP13945.1 acyl-CoA thioesterase [Alcanivorax sp. NBRC 101098]
MKASVQELMNLFDLEQLENNLFRGQSEANGQRSVFGGLVAGQALLAASRTVDDARPVHSLHAYFLRPGDFNVPIVYYVDRIRDGKSFTTRRVDAIQHGRPIFSLAASYQVAEEGVSHQSVMPDVPGPEGLENDEGIRMKLVDRLPEQFRKDFLTDRPVEFRPVTPKDSISSEPQDPVREVWFRVVDRVDANPMTQRALLAYCSDFGLMGTAMLPHGMNFWQPNVQCASIDHAMWFHNDFRIDEWLLYRSDSPFSGGSRGLNFGSIYRQDGTLVASVAQEGLMRLHPSDSPTE